MQAQWVSLHKTLVDDLTGHKVLLWISSEKPGANVQLERSAVGVFPHFVTAEMMRDVGALFDTVVHCVLPQMPPQVLVSDTSGVVETVFSKEDFPHRPDQQRCLNTYYATPDLHDLATGQLTRALLQPILEKTPPDHHSAGLRILARGSAMAPYFKSPKRYAP